MKHLAAPPRAHGHAVAASGQHAVRYGTKSRPWAVGAEAPPSAPLRAGALRGLPPFGRVLHPAGAPQWGLDPAFSARQ